MFSRLNNVISSPNAVVNDMINEYVSVFKTYYPTKPYKPNNGFADIRLKLKEILKNESADRGKAFDTLQNKLRNIRLNLLKDGKHFIVYQKKLLLNFFEDDKAFAYDPHSFLKHEKVQRAQAYLNLIPAANIKDHLKAFQRYSLVHGLVTRDSRKKNKKLFASSVYKELQEPNLGRYLNKNKDESGRRNELFG
eukprot:GHVT01020923.1.p1 GENE.GHVT01020923.1~~GHVT01020923.1.p1  ORF type:complete len:193 (+),score=13.92 GHVT01020923.1:691-1269(+)